MRRAVSRRLRHVKTDRLDGERLLAKLIRRPTGDRVWKKQTIHQLRAI